MSFLFPELCDKDPGKIAHKPHGKNHLPVSLFPPHNIFGNNLNYPILGLSIESDMS